MQPVMRSKYAVVMMAAAMQFLTAKANNGWDDNHRSYPHKNDFTRKLNTVKAAPLTFNTQGKYLEYKRKQLMEGEDSARAYVKGYEQGLVDAWPHTATVAGDGVMEIGRYIDFHEISSDGGNDFSHRIASNGGILNFSGSATFNGGIGFGIYNPVNRIDMVGDNETIAVSQSTYPYSGTSPIGGKLAAWGSGYTNAAGLKLHRWEGSAQSYSVAYIGQAHNAQDIWGLDFRITRTNSLQDADANSSRMFINPNGNVGIGTTDPQSKMHINEAEESRPGGINAATKSVLKLSRAGTGNYAFNEGAEFRIGHGSDILAGSNLDLFINSSTHYDNNTPPDKHAMTWMHNGNVGIGTTSPNAKLEINSGAAGSPGIYLGQDVDNTFLTLERWGGGGGSDFKARRFIIDGSGLLHFQYGSPTAKNSQTFVDHLAIDGNGNVGIGTTTPTTKLNILGGALRVGTFSMDPGSVDGVMSIGNVSVNYTPTQSNSTTTGSTLMLSAEDYSTIGFHDAGERVDFIRSGKGTIQLGFNGGWGEPNIGFPGTGIWKTNGNVGIGTADPKAKLHVVGIDDASAALKITDGTNAGIEIRASGGGAQYIDFANNSSNNNGYGTPDWGGRIIYNPSDVSNGFSFGTNSNLGQMVITSTGCVGINTTTPDAAYKLSVKGDVKVQKLKVTITDWSDYVFAPTYKLPTLTEVEAYINKYNHLPDVPSAETVTKDGLDVGGNQAVLLKKIEELTLYSIQQNKELKAAQERLDKLEKLITRLSKN